jgi:aldehyde:ferredoxin oxidoreductase
MDPSCDALSPESVVVIAAAPLIGTNAPTAGRGHMVFKSALSGGLGTSNCGGTWAPAFKSAGFDALVLRGRAASPVLLISGRERRKPSGRHISGKRRHQTANASSW